MSCNNCKNYEEEVKKLKKEVRNFEEELHSVSNALVRAKKDLYVLRTNNLFLQEYMVYAFAIGIMIGMIMDMMIVGFVKN
jgi:hypothetical protein